MEIKIIMMIITLVTIALCGSRDPFPLGYSMMSQGAIVETEGASGREPWTSAAFYRDTLRWGASCAAVNYYADGAAAQYAVGGFYTIGPITCKAAVSQLDAMGIYYERTASLSIGSRLRFLSFGIDANACRIGLFGRTPDYLTSAALGAALLMQTKRLSVGLAANGLTVMSGGDPYADPDPYFTARISTARNRYGSQGAMIVVTPADDAPVRFAIAQEYRIGKTFALSASIASNPTTIGFGIAVDTRPIGGSAGVVNHPFLGWSKGAHVDYRPR